MGALAGLLGLNAAVLWAVAVVAALAAASGLYGCARESGVATARVETLQANERNRDAAEAAAVDYRRRGGAAVRLRDGTF